jgi:dipeptide transport system substrate-binding protein
MRNPKHPFNIAYPAEFPVFSDLKLDEKIVKLSKIDPYTIKFMLKVPDATFLPNLATYFAPIHSFEYAQQLYRNRQAAHINQKPIGTGPFIFKRYIKNQQIRYVANKDYWDKSPGNFAKVDNLIFAITKEAAVEAKKIKAGECHIGNVPVEDVAQFQKDANFVVLTQPIMLFYALEYNTQKLKNPLVRQALDMALDKKAFIKIHKGFAQSITNPLPLLQWGYDKSIRNQSYDPIKAKLLLKKAGYSNGLTIKLFIVLGIVPTNDL